MQPVRSACRFTTTGNSAPARARFRIDRCTSRAARFRGHRRTTSDGHQLTGFRRAADDTAERHPVGHARRRAAAGQSAACPLSRRRDEDLAAEAAIDRECRRRESSGRKRGTGGRTAHLRPLLCGPQSSRGRAIADLGRRGESRSARARRRRARHARDSGASGRADGRSVGPGRRNGQGQSAPAADAARTHDHESAARAPRPAHRR